MKLITKLWVALAFGSSLVCLPAQMRPLPKESDVPILRSDSAKGDPVALYQLAVCYSEEIGVELDFQEALSLATKAAEKGDVPAMIMASRLHRGKPGVDRDKDLAGHWAQKASVSNSPFGSIALAECHRYGIGAPKSPSDTVRLLKRAARSNESHAIAALAFELLHGDPVNHNLEEGIRLAAIADKQGDRDAAVVLSLAHMLGIGLKEDTDEGLTYALKAANAGHPVAHRILGTYYATKTFKEFKKAIPHLKFAAERGDAPAQYLLAKCFREGTGVPESDKSSVRLLRDAARAGYIPAITDLGYMTWLGRERVSDLPLALGMYISAASAGEPMARAWLNSPESPRRTQDSKLSESIAHSINTQLNSGDYPVEFEEGFTSAMFGTNLRIGIAGSSKVSPATKSGSGLMFSRDGYVFTNAHVIRGASKVMILTHGSAVPINATVSAVDEANDLAIIKVHEWQPKPGAHPTPPPLASAGKSKIGDRVFSIGYPLAGLLSQEAKYTSGDISSTSGIGDDKRLFQTTTPIQPGNSGGPLALTDGRVVGIIVSSVNESYVFRHTKTIPQNINFAVKIDYLKLLASSSGIDIPEDLMPGPDPIEHVKAYTVQVIAEK